MRSGNLRRIVYQDGQRSQGNPSYSELNKYQSNYDYDQSIDRSAPYREAEVEEVESLFEGAPADIKEIVSGIEKGLRENPDNSELIARKVHLSIDYAPFVAVRECQKILEKDKKNQFALDHLAVAFMVQTDLRKAMHYASISLKQGETAQVQNIIAQIHYRLGDPETALVHYRKALQLDPNDEHAARAIQIVEHALLNRENGTKATNN